MLLLGYRYEVVYRKGENNNADPLSRYTKDVVELEVAGGLKQSDNSNQGTCNCYMLETVQTCNHYVTLESGTYFEKDTDSYKALNVIMIRSGKR